MSCFASTQTLELNFANPLRIVTGNFGVNDVVVIALTPPVMNRGDAYFTIGGGDTGSNPPTQRTYALSDKPCDFSTTLGRGAVATGITVTAYFTVGQNATNGYIPSLVGGKTYYLNIKNEVNGLNTCAGSCNMLFDLLKPNGL